MQTTPGSARFDQELNPALLQMITNSYDRTTSESYEKMREAFKAKGRGEIIALSNEERLKFVRPTAREWTAWVQEANRRGIQGDHAQARSDIAVLALRPLRVRRTKEFK